MVVIDKVVKIDRKIEINSKPVQESSAPEAIDADKVAEPKAKKSKKAE